MRIIYVEIAPADSFNENGPDILRQLYPEGEIIVPDIPSNPPEALAFLNQLAKAENADIVIGVGLGGTLVQALYGHYRILINPEFILPHCISPTSRPTSAYLCRSNSNTYPVERNNLFTVCLPVKAITCYIARPSSNSISNTTSTTAGLVY